MEHELELIIARLEILEIEVCNISYKPRDIGNLSFSTSSYPGNIGNLSFSTSSYSKPLRNSGGNPRSGG